MTRVTQYTLSMYGIKLNNGEWMKCLNGSDWYHTKEIALEILPRIIDDTQAPEARAPKYITPSDSEMHRYRSNNARMERARRSHVKNSRNGNTVKY